MEKNGQTHRQHNKKHPGKTLKKHKKRWAPRDSPNRHKTLKTGNSGGLRHEAQKKGKFINIKKYWLREDKNDRRNRHGKTTRRDKRRG